MRKISAGNIIIFLSIVATVLIWFVTPRLISTFVDPFRSIAKISALVGFVLISWNFIISTRIRFVEKLFGGLDKAYRTHHITGGLGYIFILLHPVALILSALPQFELAIFYIIPFKIPAYTFGILALYSFSILILITLFLKIPYHIWKRTHYLMGIPLILSLLHVLMIQSDKDNHPLMLVWLWLFGVLALASFIYKRVLYEFLIHTHDYKVESISLRGDITEIILKNITRPLEFEPGQFAFIRFTSAKVSREEHPFSISSSPEDDYLRFSIKNLGDFTSTLKNLKKGDIAKIKGAYGVFGEKFLTSKKPQIWIAGGIGVTPFLSMIRYAFQNKFEKTTTFFYATRNNLDKHYLDEVKDYSKNLKNIKIVEHESDTMGYINLDFIIKNSQTDIKESKFLLCGPIGMVRSIEKQLLDFGIKPYNIIYEEFALR